MLLSEWALVHAAVPRGTKLGPVLFLVMVNDLACRSNYWKYADGITISEVVPHGFQSTIHDDLDGNSACVEETCMNLNTKKKKKCASPSLLKISTYSSSPSMIRILKR